MASLHLQFVHSFYDSRQKLRHTFRRKGFKSVTIKGQVGSPDFMAAYHQLLDQTGGVVAEAGGGRLAAGSLDAVILNYVNDRTFKVDLSKSSQDMRRAIFERFRECKTPSGRRYGDNRISTLPASAIVHAMDQLGLTPNAQKNWLKALRGLMVYALAKKEIAIDPTIGVKPAKAARSKGHMTWSPDVIAQYRNHHALGTVPRLAIELLLNIAARRHDAHLIGIQHLKNGRLTWKPHKSLRTTMKTLTVPVLPEFTAALEAMPKSDTMTFMQTGHRRPFASPAAFGNAMADWCIAAGLKPVLCDDGRVRSYRAHGLRKAALVALAHSGCTGPELMAVSGHATLAQVQIYIEEADQQRMAASAMVKRVANASGHAG